MTNAAILSVACLLLLAYAVDRMGHKIGVPSVVALLVIGMATKPIMGMMGVELTGRPHALTLDFRKLEFS